MRMTRHPMLSVIALLALILTVAGAAVKPAAAGIYNIKFGYVDQRENKLVIYQDIRRIAKSKTGDFGFGYTVESKDQNFQTYCVLLPPTPLQFESDQERYKATGINSEVVNATEGYAIVRFKLDKSDPVGDYRIDIFINGGLYRTVNFIVTRD